MKKRLIVTGAGGFVAGSVLQQALDAWETHALSRGPALAKREGLVWHTFDALDWGQLETLFRDVRPDAVIHAAAIADIDYCEANRQETSRVNTELTRRVAGLCAELDARLVYVSTDNVFDGSEGNYTEDAAPSPINFYGETKVAGEKAVAELAPDAVVARTAIVMGLPVLGAGNSFLSRMIPVLENEKELGVPVNEIRSPIDVITLGQALVELAGNACTGLLHLAGNDILNRFEMARHIAHRLGFREELVVPRDPSGLPGRAARPRDVSLCNAKARKVLESNFCGLDEGLKRVLGALAAGQTP